MNIGVLGSGFIIQYFVYSVKAIEGYHLTGLWARNIEKAKAFESEFEYVTDDLDRLLNDDNIDTIYVGLPNGLHYAYAKKALSADKSVIVEKPFVVTVEEAEELFSIAKEKKLFVFEAIMTKYSDCYNEAKQYLDTLGDIKIVEASFTQYSRRYDRFKEGIILPAFDKNLAGGALMDLGVYNIHFIVGMFGRPDKVKYFANILNGVDTSGVLVLDYNSFKAVAVNAKDCNSDSFVKVIGDKGQIICHDTASRCTNMEVIYNDKTAKQLTSAVSGEMGGMYFELKEFLRIFNEKDYQTCWDNGQQTLDVQYVLEAAIDDAGLEYKGK